MRLSLENIGKIENATIEIDGITVIAGENNTGKSTVGRSLFTVSNGFCNIHQQILEARVSSIVRILSRLYQNARYDLNRNYNNKLLAESIVYENVIDSDILMKRIAEHINKYESTTVDKSLLSDIAKRIKSILQIDDEEIKKSILTGRLQEEFNGQISNIYNGNESIINLNIQEKQVSVTLKNNEVINIINPDDFSFGSETIYIDDPFIIDGAWSIPLEYTAGYDHRNFLARKLRDDNKDGSIADEIITNKRLEKIYGKIALACEGDIIKNNSKLKLGYRKQDSDKILDVRNLSTGMKTFAIIKMLLTNGTIEENGIIVLDEPEIHLHPEWQLLLAELIVLLNKEFGLHILLTTHSPYFLRAIQVYSAIHSLADRCKYYLSETENDKAIITDVSDNIESIYAKLAEPLQQLEDERWKDD